MADDTQRRQWFDPKLSIGNIITILVVLIGGVAGYYQMRSDITVIQAQLAQNMLERARLDTRVSKVEASRDDMRDRLIRVEVQLQAQNELLKRIADSVGARR